MVRLIEAFSLPMLGQKETKAGFACNPNYAAPVDFWRDVRKLSSPLPCFQPCGQGDGEIPPSGEDFQKS